MAMAILGAKRHRNRERVTEANHQQSKHRNAARYSPRRNQRNQSGGRCCACGGVVSAILLKRK
jgi:hypothetical protein